MAIGELGGAVVTVVAAGLGTEAISVISMRRRTGRKGSSCMARTWPSFTTRDLGDSPEDDTEMLRRWELYNTEMQAIIAAGGVHQDADGWWIDDATGDLIGPDPELERPRTEEELAQAKPFVDAHPDLAASILRDHPELAEVMERTRKRFRGRPRVEKPRQQVSIRLDADVLAKLKASGPGWQTRVNEILRKAVG
jgi:uncharacterized protein (DUF4415 family)